MEDNNNVRSVIVSILLLFGALGVSAQPGCNCCGFVNSLTIQYLGNGTTGLPGFVIVDFGIQQLTADPPDPIFEDELLPGETFQLEFQEDDVENATFLFLGASTGPQFNDSDIIGVGFLAIDCADPLAVYTAIGFAPMKDLSLDPVAVILFGTYTTPQEVLTLCTIVDDCNDVSQEATTIPATFERFNTTNDCRTGDAPLVTEVLDTRIPITPFAPCLNIELQKFLSPSFDDVSNDTDDALFFILFFGSFDLTLYGICNPDNSITTSFQASSSSIIDLEGTGECCRSFSFLGGLLGSILGAAGGGEGDDDFVFPPATFFRTTFTAICSGGSIGCPPTEPDIGAVCDYPPDIAFSRNTLKCIGTPLNEICTDWICDYGLEPFGEALCTAYGSWDTSRAVCGCKHGPPVPFAEDYHNSYCQEVPVGNLCFDWSCKNGLSAFGSAECTPTGWDITDAHCGCDSSPELISYAISTSNCVGTPAGEACDEWTCESGKLVSGKAICLGDSSWFTEAASCTGCVVSDWSDWSDCSATCGEGTRTRHRSIVLEDETVDVQMLDCPPVMEEETCDLGSCSKAASTGEDDVTVIVLACAVGFFGVIIVAGVLAWLSPKRRRLRQEDVLELEFHPR